MRLKQKHLLCWQTVNIQHKKEGLLSKAAYRDPNTHFKKSTNSEVLSICYTILISVRIEF